MSNDTNGNFKISAIIPTWNRLELLIQTLEKIYQCNPGPDEILVHIDADDQNSLNRIQQQYPDIKTFQSSSRQGPGGGRNILVREARNNIIASFDDDSFPLDKDYFYRLQALFISKPDISVVGAKIFHRNEPVTDSLKVISETSSFVGCGCALSKNDFIQADGYVPLPLAYGMEETDLSIRLIALGKKIYYCPWLRVIHDTDLRHHELPEINAAAIKNIALQVFLRYPVLYWPLGFFQVCNRIIWSVKKGRISGITRGIAEIPVYMHKHRKFRKPINIRKFIEVRRIVLKGIYNECPLPPFEY